MTYQLDTRPILFVDHCGHGLLRNDLRPVILDVPECSKSEFFLFAVEECAKITRFHIISVIYERQFRFREAKSMRPLEFVIMEMALLQKITHRDPFFGLRNLGD